MCRDKKGRSIELLTDARCIVGEGPLWDGENGCLLMVDIQGKRLRRIDWSSGRITDQVMKQQVGFLVPTDDGRLLGGAEDGVYLIGEDGGFTPFSKPHPIKGVRFNDGKAGPDGRMYLGTFSRDNSAAFYRLEYDGSLIELFDRVGNSNGLDFDTDRGEMYYNDTPTGRTDRFVWKDGELTDRKPVYTYEGGLPDGMTIDAAGNLWTAVWGGGCVVCVDPEKGKEIDRIELPVSQPSCCAFAGDDLKTLVITTAVHGVHLKDEPLAGSVFAVRLSTPGKAPYRFQMRGEKA